MIMLAPGRGAAWLARLTGGQEVAGSNPVAPNLDNVLKRLQLGVTHHGMVRP
jgi:hypothetical protein